MPGKVEIHSSPRTWGACFYIVQVLFCCNQWAWKCRDLIVNWPVQPLRMNLNLRCLERNQGKESHPRSSKSLLIAIFDYLDSERSDRSDFKNSLDIFLNSMCGFVTWMSRIFWEESRGLVIVCHPIQLVAVLWLRRNWLLCADINNIGQYGSFGNIYTIVQPSIAF